MYKTYKEESTNCGTTHDIGPAVFLAFEKKVKALAIASRLHRAQAGCCVTF